MNITCFDDLLTASRTQSTPQTLLMLFLDVELPEDASAAERERFERGLGGALVPRMSVDRPAADLTDWVSLAREADQQSTQWRMVLIAAVASSTPLPDIDKTIEGMIKAVHQGKIQSYVPLDRDGQAVHFN